jgi:hypothetical protein
MHVHLELEPLLAVVAGILAIVLPNRIATLVIGVYLVAVGVLDLVNVV